MLNLSRLKFNGLLKTSPLLRAYFSQYPVREIRGDYLLHVEDQAGDLQYMREIQTDDGKRGIVLKIQHPLSAYIALYQPLNSKSLTHLNLTTKNEPWQKSVEPIAKEILNRGNPSLFNIQRTKLYSKKDPILREAAKDRKLHSLSPILQICHDLNYGEMLQFSGCLGSKKTSTLLNISSAFSKLQSHTAIFVNSASQSGTKRAVEESGCWGLTAGPAKQQTDVGVYMIAVKAVRLAELLKNEGHEVLLGIDGIRHVLQAEWHMVQLLSKDQNKIPGQLAFRGPRLPPISVLNQIYSQCIDNSARGGKGSLSAILTSDNKSGDELTPQVTPYSNNLKHLNSLAKTIAFPLTFKHSSAAKINFHEENQDLPSLRRCILDIRTKINEYLIEKRQTELKRRLYKSDMNDAPWDYYQLLDAQWWMNGLQTCKIQTSNQLQHLLYWVWLNNDLELEAHWKVDCLKAFSQYQNYLQKQNLIIGKQSLSSFTTVAKYEGLFSPFKKDYLK